MRMVGPATIRFRELHPYIFNEVYRLPKGSTHKYQLTFSKQEGKYSPQYANVGDADHSIDAQTLMDIFHRIRPVRR